MEVLNSDLNTSKFENNIADTEGDVGTEVEGIDDRVIHCFLEAGLQLGTLRNELTEKECIFLVNLINQ